MIEHPTPATTPEITTDWHTLSRGCPPPAQEAHERSAHVLPIPAGDAILIERLPSGLQRISRLSGRPIGEQIPIGMDPSEGLLELITVESTLAPRAVASPATPLDRPVPMEGPDDRLEVQA